MREKDLYEIIGTSFAAISKLDPSGDVEQKANPKRGIKQSQENALRAAYRKAVRPNHPDQYPINSPAFIEAQKLITPILAAYRVLSDPIKRKGYNVQMGYEGVQTSSGTSQQPASPPDSGQSRKPPLRVHNTTPYRITDTRVGDIICDGHAAVINSLDGDLTSLMGNIYIEGFVHGNIKAEKGNVLVKGGIVYGNISAPNGIVQLLDGAEVIGTILDSQSTTTLAQYEHAYGATRARSSVIVDGIDIYTDGEITRWHDRVRIQRATFLQMTKGEDILTANSLRGEPTMQMRNGVIVGGTILKNSYHLGSGNFNLGKNPNTKEWVR